MARSRYIEFVSLTDWKIKTALVTDGLCYQKIQEKKYLVAACHKDGWPKLLLHLNRALPLHYGHL